MSSSQQIKQRITLFWCENYITSKFWKTNWTPLVHIHQSRLLSKHIQALIKLLNWEMWTTYILLDTSAAQKSLQISFHITLKSLFHYQSFKAHYIRTYSCLRSCFYYCETAFSNSNVNYFWSIKKSREVIKKLKLRNYKGSQVSSFDFSTLYNSLPYDLIKPKLLSLVKWCFNTESKT